MAMGSEHQDLRRELLTTFLSFSLIPLFALVFFLQPAQHFL